MGGPACRGDENRRVCGDDPGRGGARRADTIRAAWRYLYGRNEDVHGYFDAFRYPDRWEQREFPNPVFQVGHACDNGCAGMGSYCGAADAAVREYQAPKDPRPP